jgi:uncharacterized protein YndB with AHSA1/START domain
MERTMTTESTTSATTPTSALEVSYEADMPGTPEQVWMMIATGPGMTLWLTRLNAEEGVGGKISVQMGDDVVDMAEVTVWEPPHRYGYVQLDERRLAFELTVEARDGGTSHVRMVYSGFDSRESWEQELEGAAGGWKSCFDMMEQCLRYFPGQVGASIQTVQSTTGTRDSVMTAYMSKLGLSPIEVGAHVQSDPTTGAPELAGEIVHVEDGLAIIHLSAPAPGLAWLAAGAHGDAVMAMAHINLFGDDKDAVEAREQPVWNAWLAENFPAPPEPAPAQEATTA